LKYFSYIFAFLFCSLFSNIQGATSYEKGVELYQMNRYRDAMLQFKESVKTKKEVGNSFYYMARIYHNAKDYPKSFRFHMLAYKNRSGIEKLPQSLQACLEKLKAEMELPKFNELAQQTYDKKYYPPPIVYQMVKRHQNRGEYKEILKIYETVKDDENFLFAQTSIRGMAALIYYYVGVSYGQVEKKDVNAFPLLKKSLELDPNNSEARKMYNRAMKIQERMVDAKLNEARNSFLNRDFDKALSLYAEALKLSPGSNQASDGIESTKLAKLSYEKSGKARQLYDKGEPEKALREVKFALTAYSDNFEAKTLKKDIESAILKKLNLENQVKAEQENQEKQYFTFLSQAENSLNNDSYEEAIDLFEKASQLRPDSKRAKEGLNRAKDLAKAHSTFESAQEDLKNGNASKALETLNQLKKEGRSFQGMQPLVIEANFKQNNYAKTIELAQDYLALRPNDFAVLYFMARSYEDSKDAIPDSRKKAIQSYRKLTNLKPGYADVDSRLSRLQNQFLFPILVVVVVLGLVIAIVVWFYKTRHDRKKVGFLNRVEKLAQKEAWKDIVDLYGEFYEVELDIRETLKVYPVFMQAMVECERFGECLKIGPKILTAMPNHRQAQVFMGLAHFGNRAINPNNLKYYISVFESDFVTDEMIQWVGERLIDLNLVRDETIPLLWRFNELFPENEECRKILLEQLGKEKVVTKQLVDLMELEVKYNKNDTKCRLKLADHYLKKKKYDQCIRFCEEVINLNVTDRKLHTILYAAYEEQGSIDALLPVYESLLQLFPNSIILQETKNKILLATGRQGLSQVQLNALQNQGEEPEGEPFAPE